MSTRYKDLLDYTISYRAVWTVLGFMVVIAVASYLLWSELRGPGEDEKARQEVKAAERLQRRAEGCVASPDAAAAPGVSLEEAVQQLRSAQSLLDDGQWVQASEQARAASDSYKRYIDRACSARDSVAEFVDMVGDVKVKKLKSPRWVPARRDTPLEEGDRISTEGGGYARIVYEGGDTHEIREGTLIEIKSARRQPDGVVRTQTNLEMGEITMTGMPGNGSTVQTPFMTVEPGQDRVEIESPAGGTSSRARSVGPGGARVRDAGGKELTLKRATRVEGGSGGLGDVVVDLPNPELGNPVDGRVFTYEKPDETDTVLEWRKVEGAVDYVFQLALSDKFILVLNRDDQRVSGLSVVLGGLKPGQFFWRVAAVDARGVRCTWSEVRRFTIRSALDKTVKLPPKPKLSLESRLPAGDQVIVTGKTDPYATLECFVGNQKFEDVDVGDDGSFQTFVRLPREGRNVIRLLAHDQYGQTTVLEFEEFLTLP